MPGNDSDELSLGQCSAWQIKRAGDVKIAQAEPSGLAVLENRLRTKAEMMAALGARLLEAGRIGGEFAAAINPRHRGERSLLGAIAGTTERGLSRAVTVAAWQQGGVGGETLYDKLNAAERPPGGMTCDDWQFDIQTHGATMAFTGLDGGDAGDVGGVGHSSLAKSTLMGIRPKS